MINISEKSGLGICDTLSQNMDYFIGYGWGMQIPGRHKKKCIFLKQAVRVPDCDLVSASGKSRAQAKWG